MAAGLALLLASCSFSSTGCPNLNEISRSTTLHTLRHANGAVAARGRRVRDWNARVGRWTFWYEGGGKRAEAMYAVSCYLHCCSAGPCPQVHDYPVGGFTVWYPSGRKFAQGTFDTVSRHVETSCAGGAYTQGARISPATRFWREDGSPMPFEEGRVSAYLLPDW